MRELVLCQGLLLKQGLTACVKKRAHVTTRGHLPGLRDAFSRAAGIIFAVFLFKQYSVQGHSKTLHKFLEIHDTLL